VVRDVYGLDNAWQAIESLDNKVPVEVQTSAHLAVRRLLDRAVRWLIFNRPSPIDVEGEIERIRPGVKRLLPELSALLQGGERRALAAGTSALVARGIPGEIADLVIRIRYGSGLLDVVETAHRTGRDVGEAADLYFVLSERFRVDDLLSK